MIAYEIWLFFFLQLATTGRHKSNCIVFLIVVAIFLGQNSQHQTEFITIGMLNFVPTLSECFCLNRVLLPFFRTKKSVRTFFVDKNFFLNNVADQQADKNVKHFIHGQKDHRCKPAMNNTKSIFKLVELQ